MNPTEYLASLGCDMNADLTHYGTKRHSGRYPWGSGERPYQSEPRQSGEYKLNKVHTRGSYTVERVARLAAEVPLAVLSRLFPPAAIIRGAMLLSSKSFIKEKPKATNISELPKKNKDVSLEEDLKLVNRGLKTDGRTMNCADTVIATEMRRRGYDVRAIKNPNGEISTVYEKIFKGAKKEYPYANEKQREGESYKGYANRVYNDLCNKLESLGNGARGTLGIVYTKFASGPGPQGHALYWEVKDGKVSIYDAQSGGNKKLLSDSLACADPTGYNYARLDNAELTDEVLKYVVPLKKGDGK